MRTLPYMSRKLPPRPKAVEAQKVRQAQLSRLAVRFAHTAVGLSATIAQRMREGAPGARAALGGWHGKKLCQWRPAAAAPTSALERVRAAVTDRVKCRSRRGFPSHVMRITRASGQVTIDPPPLNRAGFGARVRKRTRKKNARAQFFRLTSAATSRWSRLRRHLRTECAQV